MKITKIVSILAFVLASAGLAFAVAPGKVQVESVSEGVVMVGADGAQKPLVAGDVFSGATTISTPADASARVVLGSGTIIALRPNTKISIVQFDQNNPDAVEGKDFTSFSNEPEETSGSQTTVRVDNGTATFKVAKLLPSSSLTVKTRAGDVLVKGTTLTVAVNATGVSVSVTDGAVQVVPTGKATVSLSAGRTLELPVSENGNVGTPSLKIVSADERQLIEREISVDNDSTRNLNDDRNIGVALDPEVPGFAEGSDVKGPNDGYLNTDSPSSAGTK